MNFELESDGSEREMHANVWRKSILGRVNPAGKKDSMAGML